MNHGTSLVEPNAVLRAWSGIARVHNMDARVPRVEASCARPPRKPVARKPIPVVAAPAPRPWALITPDRPCTAPAGHDWWPLLRA